jgi:hypothetical protein
VTDVDDIFTILNEKYMCSLDCPCVEVDERKWFRKTDLTLYYFTGEEGLGQEKVEECSGVNKMDEKMVEFVKDLEVENNCNGVCLTKDFYLFTGVTK